MIQIFEPRKLLGLCSIFLSMFSLAEEVKTLPGSQHLSYIRDQPESYCRRNFFPTDLRLSKGVDACPANKGYQILPNTFPPGALFVGVSQLPEQLEMLEVLIDEALSHDPPVFVNVLVPSAQIEKLRPHLEKYFKYKRSHYINFIQTASSETVWVQDYFEVPLNLATGDAALIDLPYEQGAGDLIPSSLSLSCQTPILASASAKEIGKEYPSGSFGGNIESYPGSILAIGNNMSPVTRNMLQKNLNMEQFSVNVNWLATGHVDEVFSLVRDNSGPDGCKFAVLYASPDKAFEIIQKNGGVSEKDKIAPDFPVQYEEEQDHKNFIADQKTVLGCLNSKNIKTPTQSMPTCQTFLSNNRSYSKIVETDLKNLLSKISQKTGCKKIRNFPIPLLFKDDDFDRNGSHHAAPLNPNGVNGILISKTMIQPRQPYLPFQNEINRVLKDLGIKPRFVKSQVFHHLQGGLHCLTNVVRVCRPR